MTDLIPMPPAPLAPTDRPLLTIDQAVNAWLNAKHGISKSQRTEKEYKGCITAFRATLGAGGLDLASEAPKVRLAAQGWAGKGNAAPATFNQRLAILSSFYEYAIRNEVLELQINPIDAIERRHVEAYEDAKAIDPQHAGQQLKQIDRSTLAGMRDYALLRIAIATGWRVAELAGLRWCDLRGVDGQQITIDCRRAKKGKKKRDTLAPSVSTALMSYLQAVYGAQLGQLAPDAPIWVSVSRNGTAGQALSRRALQAISEKRLGIHIHATRATTAMLMEKSGATLTDIQQQLGHSNPATTGLYLRRLRGNENSYSNQMDKLMGID